MKTISISTSYKKSMKKVVKYKEFNAKKLEEYLKLLSSGKELPENAKDHKLAKHSSGVLQGARDFHIAPNLCVVYRMDADTIYLINIAKHSDLGLTENLKTS